MIAVNAFVATTASAYNFNATKVAKIAGKSALGIIALATVLWMPFQFDEPSTGNTPIHDSLRYEKALRQNHFASSDTIPGFHFDIGNVEFCIPYATAIVTSGIIGYLALKSAWDDIKNINK